MLIDQLKFVKGAVNTKGIIPELAHFKIKDGQVQGYNGSLALSSPIDVDFECMPIADTFVKAIANCGEDVALSLINESSLQVTSGTFNVRVKCLPLDNDIAHKAPEGDYFGLDGFDLLSTIKLLEPFIGKDATRPWSRGLFFKHNTIWVTNNIIAIECKMPTAEFPVMCNVPHDVIKEFVRLNQNPLGVQVSESSITFHYADGRWVKGKLLSQDWPDLSAVLGDFTRTLVNGMPLTEDFFNVINKLAHFTDREDRLYFTGDSTVTTVPQKGEGASEFLEGTHRGVYHANILQLLHGVVTEIDFTSYPKPCKFIGPDLHGVVIGLRH